jgi:hypothetical protein
VKRNFKTRALLVAALVAGGAPAARAQAISSSSRPVFGQGSAAATGATTFDVTVDVAEAYDSNLNAELGNITPSVYQVSGAYTLFAPQARFAANGSRVQFAATGGSSARYFNQSDVFVLNGYNLGLGLTAELTRSTTVTISEGVTYAPSYLYGLFQQLATPSVGGVVPSASNYGVDGVQSLATVSTARLTHHMTPRAAFSLSGSYGRTDMVNNFVGSGYSDLLNYSAGGAFTYSLNKGMTVRMGYTYRDGQYTELVRSKEHDIDLGVNYTRPISQTRKLNLNITVGPRVMDQSSDTTGLVPLQTFGVVADVGVSRQIGRTWTAQGGYHRGLAFIEGLPGPAYTDSVAGSTRGFLSRRVDLSIAGSVARGNLSQINTASAFTTYTADARLQRAVGGKFALYAEYLYYFYDFGRGIQLPVGVTPTLTRNTVRFGLSLWLPLKDR